MTETWHGTSVSEFPGDMQPKFTWERTWETTLKMCGFRWELVNLDVGTDYVTEEWQGFTLKGAFRSAAGSASRSASTQAGVSKRGITRTLSRTMESVRKPQ